MNDDEAPVVDEAPERFKWPPRWAPEGKVVVKAPRRNREDRRARAAQIRKGTR